MTNYQTFHPLIGNKFWGGGGGGGEGFVSLVLAGELVGATYIHMQVYSITHCS